MNDNSSNSSTPTHRGFVLQDNRQDDQGDERLGHVRVAATMLDCDIPTKRPRLSSSRMEYRSQPESPFGTSTDSNEELSPTATAARFFHSPTHLPPGMIVIEPYFSHLHATDRMNIPDPSGDENSSCGWSLRPLAPSTSAPLTAVSCFQDTSDYSFTSHGSNCSASFLQPNADRWRSSEPMSSFSSTLTEISTNASREPEENNNMESQQQPPAALEYNEETNNFSIDTAIAAVSKSKRKSQKPQQQQSTETVDQLTARLNHWCSITNLRALKRRNNIYADDQHKSPNYNPNQVYDYSNYQLSRHIRKLQCQSAKQEVMRAIKFADNSNINAGDSESLWLGDENKPSPSNYVWNQQESSPRPPSSPNPTAASIAQLKQEAPPTPTMSNTTSFKFPGVRTNTTTAGNHSLGNAPLDVIMGDSCL